MSSRSARRPALTAPARLRRISSAFGWSRRVAMSAGSALLAQSQEKSLRVREKVQPAPAYGVQRVSFAQSQ